MQSDYHQCFMVRCLSNIAEMPCTKQQLVLSLCRRALDPSRICVWPAHQLLRRPSTSEQAARLVQCMSQKAQLSLITDLVLLPCRAAIEMVHDLSQVPSFASRVASAVLEVEFQPYMNRLGLSVLWRMVDHLRECKAGFALQRLFRSHRGEALQQGVFTTLVEMGHVVDPLVPMDPFPFGVHMAVFHMYSHGIPVKVARVMAKEPRALRVLAEMWPSIAREERWVRRRMFVMCMYRCQGGRQHTFWQRIARLDSGPVSVIGKYL